MQRIRFGHRRASPEKEESSNPLTNRTNIDFRNSALNEYKLSFDRDEEQVTAGRHSFDIDSNPTPLKGRVVKMGKLNSYDNIRNTLTELKKKI